jgi:hypothetical protein
MTPASGKQVPGYRCAAPRNDDISGYLAQSRLGGLLACAYGAREAKTDQDQAIEIPRFRDRETGDNRLAKSGWAMISGIGEAPGKRPCYVGSWNVPVKKLATQSEDLRSSRHVWRLCERSLPAAPSRHSRASRNPELSSTCLGSPLSDALAETTILDRHQSFHICGRLRERKKNLRGGTARSQVLTSVRPVLRPLSCRGPVWEFADRVQITATRSRRRVRNWLPDPVSH